jgi:hypothetical protein
MNAFHIWFLIFICIGYLIVTDNSIAQLFILSLRFARAQYEKIKWWLLYNPDSIIVRWLIHRKYLKIAKELHRELAKKD